MEEFESKGEKSKVGALYVKDTSIHVDNAGKKNNIVTGDVPAGSVIGLGPGVSTKPAPATPPVKPIPGVPGVPGVGGDGNVSPPTPPAPPATPATPTQTDPWCCQTFGMCPAGYLSSGNVNANSVCCKDYSHGISINSDMPYCPTTPANDPFPNPNWTPGDGIGLSRRPRSDRSRRRTRRRASAPSRPATRTAFSARRTRSSAPRNRRLALKASTAA